MDGFKKPRQRPANPRVSVPPREFGPSTDKPQGVNTSVSDEKPVEKAALPVLAPLELPPEQPQKRSPGRRGKKPLIIVGSAIAVLAMLLIVGWIWYIAQLKPVDSAATNETDVTVTPETSYSYAMKSLKSKGLIRSDLAATIYGYLSGTRNNLKEGTCRIKASQSTPDIIATLTKGCNEFRSVTFFPGATIEKPLYKPDHAQIDQTMNIKSVLEKSGYTEAQIAAALSKTYSGPLFDGKPSGSSLEGYVYGETYHVDPNATAETVLQTAFDQMYKDIQRYDLKTDYSAKGLNLFQGITLASIVQRELNCEGKYNAEGVRDEARTERCYQYQRTIAQIFLKRLKEDIQLGSDVTFIYAADQMKVPPRVDLDSPYNTRKYAGLPPGPIASPGVHALRAVADPSDTDYLYFIAGDDGLIYFAKTDAEHEANIKNHCQKLCNEL